jgi:hypothetical protein
MARSPIANDSYIQAPFLNIHAEAIDDHIRNIMRGYVLPHRDQITPTFRHVDVKLYVPRREWGSMPPLDNRPDNDNSEFGFEKQLHDKFWHPKVITHPYPTATQASAGTASTLRRLARALRPLRRPVSTIEQRSA